MNTPTMTAAARLAARLLAHRQTAQEEVGDLIRNVHDAVARLSTAPEAAAEPAAEAEAEAAPPQPRQRRSRREAAAPPPPETSEGAR